MLFQIDAPYFCAGGEIVCGYVINVAPIIRYMKGWVDKRVYEYCQRKRWKFHILDIKKEGIDENIEAY